jgi:hypothetical protein
MTMGLFPYCVALVLTWPGVFTRESALAPPGGVPNLTT